MKYPEKYLVTAGGRIKCLRCTAMSKHTGEQCRKPALKISRTRKCGHHGGKGSGPKTAEGKARIGNAHLLHGEETNQRKLERSESSLRLAQLEDVARPELLAVTEPARPPRSGRIAGCYCVARMPARSEPFQGDRVARERRALRSPNIINRGLH